MKLSKAQWILLGCTVIFVTFTVAFFIGRSSVHAVIATERVPEAGVSDVPAATASLPEVQTRINLNTAQAIELETLPGIGAVLAERIIRFREENGGFLSTEQLMDVEGIGEVKYQELKDLIYVEALS